MRKIDYQILAQLIRSHTARSMESPKNHAYWMGYGDALAVLASEFADRAHVDRAEFLKACGIKP